MSSDFMPVSLIATGPAVLVVNPASPLRAVADVVDAAKASAGHAELRLGGHGHLRPLHRRHAQPGRTG